MIKSTFFDIKTGEASTPILHLYTGCFIFSQKRRAHSDLILEGFLHVSSDAVNEECNASGIHRLELGYYGYLNGPGMAVNYLFNYRLDLVHVSIFQRPLKLLFWIVTHVNFSAAKSAKSRLYSLQQPHLRKQTTNYTPQNYVTNHK